MATITVSLPSDGDTIDVADYNTPINTIVNDYNGNITNDNISATAAIAGTKIGGAWTSWTPTFSNLTLGNGTSSGFYSVIGKTIIARGYVLFGSTTSIGGTVTLTSPLSIKTHTYSTHIGQVRAYDANTTTYYDGSLYHISSSSAIGLGAMAVNGTNINVNPISATVPFTFTTGDIITFQWTAELA